jgi:hypothetical protein
VKAPAPPVYVDSPDMRVLMVLVGMAGHYGKRFCFPSHKTICAKLKQYYGRTMSVRTVCRHLGALEREKRFTRERRHQTAPDGSLICHSTLYMLTGKTLNLFGNLGKKLWINIAHRANSVISKAVTDLANNLENHNHSYYKEVGSASWEERRRR